MSRFIIILLLVFGYNMGQSQDAKSQIKRTCFNYIEGFYEGDTSKIIQALTPKLYKIGYWKKKGATTYEYDGAMTFEEAIAYAKRVNDRKMQAKPGSPKEVHKLDIGNSIAAAKITAWWGSDYVLLSKQNESWKIEEVLWEGPLAK